MRSQRDVFLLQPTTLQLSFTIFKVNGANAIQNGQTVKDYYLQSRQNDFKDEVTLLAGCDCFANPSWMHIAQDTHSMKVRRTFTYHVTWYVKVVS